MTKFRGAFVAIVTPFIDGQLDEQGLNEPMGYCFPHYFVLPMYSSAASYRFRPLGPEETLMEIWSLTRPVEGEEHSFLAPGQPANNTALRRYDQNERDRNQQD